MTDYVALARHLMVAQVAQWLHPKRLRCARFTPSGERVKVSA